MKHSVLAIRFTLANLIHLTFNSKLHLDKLAIVQRKLTDNCSCYLLSKIQSQETWDSYSD